MYRPAAVEQRTREPQLSVRARAASHTAGDAWNTDAQVFADLPAGLRRLAYATALEESGGRTRGLADRAPKRPPCLEGRGRSCPASTGPQGSATTVLGALRDLKSEQTPSSGGRGETGLILMLRIGKLINACTRLLWHDVKLTTKLS